MAKITAEKYVDIMCERHNHSLSTLERTAYLEAARIAMTVDAPLSFSELHSVLMSQDLTAGLYRERVVLDKFLCTERPFPRPKTIRGLVFDVHKEYQATLQLEETKLNDIELQLHMWCIAARLRCIRPFDRGTTRLSYLILGQMRRVMGFDFLCEEFSLETYHEFRSRYQNEHQHCYGRFESAA